MSQISSSFAYFLKNFVTNRKNSWIFNLSMILPSACFWAGVCRLAWWAGGIPNGQRYRSGVATSLDTML
jgi:hypothetical protein